MVSAFQSEIRLYQTDRLANPRASAPRQLLLRCPTTVLPVHMLTPLTCVLQATREVCGLAQISHYPSTATALSRDTRDGVGTSAGGRIAGVPD